MKTTINHIFFILLSFGISNGQVSSINAANKADSTIQNYLNEKSTIIDIKEYGGGDCYGKYISSKLDDENFLITRDNFDCGEYGFTHKIYILLNDILLYVKYNIKETELSLDGTKYSLREIIFDFSKPEVSKFSRSKDSKEYSDNTFSGIFVHEVIKNRFSILNKEMKEYDNLKSKVNYHEN